MKSKAEELVCVEYVAHVENKTFFHDKNWETSSHGTS